MDPIVQVVIIFITATVLAYISRLIKQPIIPAYIIAGIILILTGLIQVNNLVDVISTLGIAFLLFLVGLEIDFDRLKNVGLVATVGCTILCTLLFGIGYFASILLGIAKLPSVYIGLVAAFSSTMIVVKLLSDNSQLDTLHGRIILGTLLMQDILAIIALFVLSSINNGSASFNISISLIMMAVIFAITIISSKFIFPQIFKFAAKTEELLFITAISVCLIYIGLFHYMGLSIAIGAFLAGVALGNLPYSLEIISLIKPIRDFFGVIFFVSLGLLLNLKAIQDSWAIIILLLIITLLIKPFLIIIIVSLFGYKGKPTLFSAVSLAQASEFGLILLLSGLSLGHISESLFSAVVLVTIISMTLTAYLFEYKKVVYKLVHKHLKFIEKMYKNTELEYDDAKIKKDVLMVGYDRLGYNIFNTLIKQKKKFIVVDYNPEIIKDLSKKKIPCLYGDIGDIEILHRLDLKSIKLIISTVPDKEDSLMLIKKAKEQNSKSTVILTSIAVDDAVELYEAGADYVILPHFLGGERVSLILEEIKSDTKRMLEYKISHLKELKMRKHLKHKHPKRRRHR